MKSVLTPLNVFLRVLAPQSSHTFRVFPWVRTGNLVCLFQVRVHCSFSSPLVVLPHAVSIPCFPLYGASLAVGQGARCCHKLVCGRPCLSHFLLSAFPVVCRRLGRTSHLGGHMGGPFPYKSNRNGRPHLSTAFPFFSNRFCLHDLTLFSF